MLPNPNAPRLLLIDQDLNRARRIGAVLEQQGYYVQNAYNVGDALFAAETSRFNAALINTDMRDRDGTPILDLWRSAPRAVRLPFLNLNGFTLDQPGQETVILNPLLQLINSPVVNSSTTGANGADNAAASVTTGGDSSSQLRRDVAELQTLAALSQSVSSSLDLSEVLNQIVDAATSLTSADEGMLLLPDETGTALVIRAMKGIDSESARSFRIKTEDNLAGRVFTSGQSVLVGAQGRQKLKTEYFVNALLYVPLTYKSQTIGVLGVNNRRSEHSFSPHDRDLLLALAAHASIALANARLYEQQVAQTRQLATLVEAGRVVNSTLALDAVLTSICQQIIRALAVSGCLIDESTSDNGDLRALAASRRVVWPLGKGPSFDLEARPAFKTAITQNMYYLVSANSTQAGWTTERNYLERIGVDHLMMLPLRANGQVGNSPNANTVNDQPVGALELFYPIGSEQPDINSDFRRLVRTLAGPMSLAEPDEALRLAQSLLDQTGACRCVLWLYDPDGRLTQCLDYGDQIWLGDRRPRGTTGSLKLADLATKQLSTHPLVSKRDGVQAVLSLPLMLRGRTIGAVTVYNVREPHHYSAEENDLARALVSQAATAIENARLFHDLDRSLSDLKTAQIKLVESARLSAIGELAAVVAHQIDNPLTAVLGNAEYLLQDMAADDPKRDALETILRAGRRAHTVGNRLLSMARRGTELDQLQVIDANTTINAVLELVTAHVQRAHISLNVDLSAAVLNVRTLPGQLEDVWLNFILNARYALLNSPEAVIEVRSRIDEDYAVITVSDNGPGIPLDYQTHLFDAFFTTKPAGEGTGLGLYICKQIVERAKGTITLDSAPGSGTRFTVRLPLVPEE
jgi:signal transduction histidine kinase/CheY-like chemotaxis protein